jgi:SAM-dependent methyltransferase
MARPQRLIFGEVAELYDRHRPTYPAALVEDLLAEAGPAPGDRLLEVGAGTGKATELFAARGAAVLAVEPSEEMAAVARRRCAAYPGVEIVESDFERLELDGEDFPLLYSAQAWHWIDPAVRYQRARAALAPGGLLAAFWNRPAWGRSEIREALAAAYRRFAPDMRASTALHPENRAPQGDEDWAAQIASAPGLEDPRVRFYSWSQGYSSADYAGLISTLSDVQLLEPPARAGLLHAIEAAILEHGGTLTMPLVTRLYIARAV